MDQISNLIETTELLAFVRTVEARSLSRAALELRVPRATISRRLARLEQRLGARLLRRTTRSLTLTDAGETFYRQARIVLDALTTASTSVRRNDDQICGDLRVSVPPLNDDSFRAMVSAFARKYPSVRLQIDFSSRLVDLRREGYDVALRATTSIEPGLVARRIGRQDLLAAASPAYLAAQGTPQSSRDLKKHRLLVSFARGELPQTTWPAGRTGVHVNASFSSNDLRMLVDAALHGLGIVLLPDLVLHEHLASGALVQVLPGVLRAQNNLSVVYPEKEFLPAQVRAFIDELVDWAERAFGEPRGKRRRA